ncbi:histidine kinase [Limosilactobacillus antri]|uniref:histidine kinase n=1 Tax=Limosilactobacillus antri TaxID=227943 RepID=UPI001F577C11|nr:histidine kinase [Limosilactobacillus antri]
MAFDVNIASDHQIDTILHSIKRIPTWKLENTQSEREHKRIHQLQLHNQQFKQEKTLIKKRKKQRMLAKSKLEVKKSKIDASDHTSNDELTL